ncbi:MAG: polyvinylalcohol dehydrogenase [Planctomycetota bacterium]|nr:MAG: polyvinylalcohol dehydrogenase [Planctomycetota bacterium]
MQRDGPVTAAPRPRTTVAGVPIIPDRPRVPVVPPPPRPPVAKPPVASASPVPKAASNPSPRSAGTRPVPPSDTTAAAVDVVTYRPNWPQFRGPDRANRSTDRGLLERWPADGPRVFWVARGLGEGYSSVSTDGRVLLTMGNLEDHEAVIALDFETGRRLWTYRNGPAYRNGQGNGPRSTPTIDGDRLYALGASGDLSCAELATGRVLWRRNILRDFGGRNITWGISESVLIDGDRLICTPGGNRATVVALDKNTGETLWTCQVTGRPQASYASPIVITVGAVRQYVVFTSKNVVGIEAETGRELWANGSSANSTANCSTPVFEDGLLFSASGYGTGGACLRLAPGPNGTIARELYTTKEMKNHHGGMVVVDGYLYGSSDPGILTCIELRTGRVMWKNRSVGKGSVTYADGHIYLRSERGPVALVRATPNGYEEHGRFAQPQRSNRPAWPHPVVTGGRLFLRDMDILLCYDLRPEFQ